MTITIEIRPEIEAELNETASAQGLSAEQYARQLLEKALVLAVRAKLPADGASEHDHYIYGAPRRAE